MQVEIKKKEMLVYNKVENRKEYERTITTIDTLNANISSDLKLSRRYTNHSIWVTTVTVLKENGYTSSNSDICK